MEDVIRFVVPIVVIHFIALVALVLVIKKLLLGDTRRAISSLRQVETEVRKKEEQIRRDIEQHEKDFEKQKAAAEAEQAAILKEEQKKLATLKDQTLAEARKEADRIVEEARNNEEKFRKQLAQDVEEKAVDFGGQVFKLVITDLVNEEVNRRFVGELLDALDEIESGAITVDGDEAEFVCSHSLADDQKARFRDLLKEKFGADVEVNEKIDENLIAGMSFKLGSLEIDGSLLNRFKEAVQEVKKSTTV